MVRYALKLVSKGCKITRITDAPGACDTEGLTSNTNNHLNFATGQRPGKAIATQIAQLALAGHTVHKLHCGDFLVCKRSCSQYSQYAQDPEALQHLARKLGVSK